MDVSLAPFHPPCDEGSEHAQELPTECLRPGNLPGATAGKTPADYDRQQELILTGYTASTDTPEVTRLLMDIVMNDHTYHNRVRHKDADHQRTMGH